MFEKINVWAIDCGTGCTCCDYKDFVQGFYKTEEEAREQMNQWRKGINNPLASQYAKYGLYSLFEKEAEILPDGRMIIDNRVFEKEFFGRIDDWNWD